MSQTAILYYTVSIISLTTSDIGSKVQDYKIYSHVQAMKLVTQAIIIHKDYIKIPYFICINYKA